MSKKIELESSIVVKLINAIIVNSNKNILEELTIVEALNNKQLINLLAVSKADNNYDFLSLSIHHQKIEWTKVLIKNAEMQKEIKNNLLNTNTKVPLLVSSLANLHIDYMNRNNTYLRLVKMEEIFEMGNYLSLILLNSNESEKDIYKKIFNNIDNNKIKKVPLFFNLLHFFKNDIEKINDLNIIQWNKTDELGNTVFHNILSYDESLYPFLLSILELTGNSNIKNKNNETPLEVWIKYSVDKMPKDIWIAKIANILKQQKINWKDKEHNLKELIKRISSTYILHKTKNVSIFKEEILIEMIEEIVKIPEYNSNKIKGFLRGLFYCGKNNTQRYSASEIDGLNIVKSIFFKNSLENTLTDNQKLVKKMKL
jgi:hypothetical protein